MLKAREENSENLAKVTKKQKEGRKKERNGHASFASSPQIAKKPPVRLDYLG